MRSLGRITSPNPCFRCHRRSYRRVHDLFCSTDGRSAYVSTQIQALESRSISCSRNEDAGFGSLRCSIDSVRHIDMKYNVRYPQSGTHTVDCASKTHSERSVRLRSAVHVLRLGWVTFFDVPFRKVCWTFRRHRPGLNRESGLE